jgi:hypothetical protein
VCTRQQPLQAGVAWALHGIRGRPQTNHSFVLTAHILLLVTEPVVASAKHGRCTSCGQVSRQQTREAAGM